MDFTFKGTENSTLTVSKKRHKDNRDLEKEAVFLGNFLVWNFPSELVEKTIEYIKKKVATITLERAISAVLEKTEGEEPVITVNYPNGDCFVSTVDEAFNMLFDPGDDEVLEDLDDPYNGGIPNEDQ